MPEKMAMNQRRWARLATAVQILSFLALLPQVDHAQPGQDSIAKPQQSYFAYVGTYTQSASGPTGSNGIYLYRYHAETAQFTPLGVAARMVNPTFIATDPSHRFLYAVTEIGDDSGLVGSISSFAINPVNGSLKFLNKVSSEGGNPAYIAVDHTGKMLIVANYLSGNVASFPINPDGSLGKRTGFDQHKGSSINPVRQSGPHAHEAVPSPDNRFLFVPDLGLDKVFIYRLEPKNATFVPNTPAFASVAPGLGPRHITFGRGAKFAYLICEMGSRVVVFSYDQGKGSLKQVQSISTLPAGFSGTDTSAEIEVDRSGRFLYASNRGNDSITVFGINPRDGMLTKLQVVPTQGKTPRHFAIDRSGRYLIAENQDSATMVTFKIDPNTGKLAPTGDVVKLPAPVCLVFVPEK